jgi:anti-anti-sigma factor
MVVSTEDLPGGIVRVVMVGRLDYAGAAVLDAKLKDLGAAQSRLLLDMQRVSFLGSMGLHTIVTPAQALHKRGGKVAILSPTELVESVLRGSGVDTLIPIHHDLAHALADLN